MVVIHDKVIEFFPRMQETDFKTLLVISRYLTEKTPINLTKLRGFWHSDEITINRINSLVSLKLINIYSKDKNTQYTNIGGLPLEGGIIFDTLDTSRHTEVFWEISENLPDSSLIDKLELLVKVDNRRLIAMTENVTNYFLSSRIRKVPVLKIDRRDKMKNFKVANTLITKYPEFTYEDWCKAIQWFMEHKFWGPQFNDLSLLSRKLPTYLMEVQNKSKSLPSNIRIIS